MRLMKLGWVGAITLGSLIAAGPMARAQEKKADEKPAPATPKVDAPAAPGAPGLPGARPDLRTTRVEARLKALTQTLSLTDEQKAKIKPILEEEVKKFEEMQQDKTLASADRMKSFREVRSASQAKIRTLLTPEQQQKMDSRQAPRPPGAAPAAPAAPPK